MDLNGGHGAFVQKIADHHSSHAIPLGGAIADMGVLPNGQFVNRTGLRMGNQSSSVTPGAVLTNMGKQFNQGFFTEDKTVLWENRTDWPMVEAGTQGDYFDPWNYTMINEDFNYVVRINMFSVRKRYSLTGCSEFFGGRNVFFFFNVQGLGCFF